MTVETETHDFSGIKFHKRLKSGALERLAKTREIDEEFDRSQKSRTQRLNGLEKALKEQKFKVVVVGEFSRGKSTLLNAILGERILPTANQQTTAINTFIQGVEEGEEPYINIVYFDGRTERLSWDAGVIEKWGTELNKENRDARLEVERIEAFSDHELLQHDLILIDTPGFEGILEAHEEIARNAMDESHVALWINSAEQLGGNKRELEFLKESIAKNFDKFITVINKWDLVLEPMDAREKERSRRERVESALSSVRDNFKKFTADSLSKEKIDRLTADSNLMGVSGVWAFSGEEEKSRQSNIIQLARRIEDMCLSGESSEQMLIKPLKSLSVCQDEILKGIDAELKETKEADDLDELRKRRENLNFEIRDLGLKRDTALADAKKEHDFHAKDKSQRVQEELIAPLKELKASLELVLTKRYVQREINRGVGQVQLPAGAKDEFEAVHQRLNEDWEKWRRELEETLAKLRHQFTSEMNRAGRQLADSLDSFELDLPELEVELDIDLSDFERFHKQRSELTQRQRELEEALNENALEKAELMTNPTKLKQQEQRLNQIRRKLESLGGPPPPRQKTETRTRTEKRTWRSDKKESVEVPVEDYSNVREWKKKAKSLKRKESQLEAEARRVQEEEFEKKQKKVSLDIARRKVERDLQRANRELEELKRRSRETRAEVVENTLRRLRKKTLFKVEHHIYELEKNVAGAIEGIFQDQLKALSQMVESKYMEPLEAKQKSLEEIASQLEMGEEATAEGLERLESLKGDLKKIKRETMDLIDLASDKGI